MGSRTIPYCFHDYATRSKDERDTLSMSTIRAALETPIQNTGQYESERKLKIEKDHAYSVKPLPEFTHFNKLHRDHTYSNDKEWNKQGKHDHGINQRSSSEENISQDMSSPTMNVHYFEVSGPKSHERICLFSQDDLPMSLKHQQYLHTKQLEKACLPLESNSSVGCSNSWPRENRFPTSHDSIYIRNRNKHKLRSISHEASSGEDAKSTKNNSKTMSTHILVDIFTGETKDSRHREDHTYAQEKDCICTNIDQQLQPQNQCCKGSKNIPNPFLLGYMREEHSYNTTDKSSKQLIVTGTKMYPEEQVKTMARKNMFVDHSYNVPAQKKVSSVSSVKLRPKQKRIDHNYSWSNSNPVSKTTPALGSVDSLDMELSLSDTDSCEETEVEEKKIAVSSSISAWLQLRKDHPYSSI